MARQAYPDVPLFRYDYTDLSQAQIAAKLAAAAKAGPTAKGKFDSALAGRTLDFTGDDGSKLSWKFGAGNRVSFNGADAGYGALDLGQFTLISHLVPGTTTGYAIAWDRTTNLATVFELWFGGGPAPKARELNREIYFGTMAGGPATEARHHFTFRIEGRALAWTEDTGHRTIDYYPSIAYTHWVELDRLHEGRGYSAPADYIQLNEDFYAYTRVEAEFSGLMQLYLMDMNRLQQVGLRLGFNGLDELEFYMFRGTGEWLGQLARFEKFGDTSAAETMKVPNGKKGERRVYRPLATMDKMTPAEVDAVVAAKTEVFARPSPMAGNGLPPTEAMTGKQFAIHYDGGPLMEYRIKSGDSLEWCKDNGNWVTARYNAWESMPGVFIFGHLLEGEKNHDGHIVVADFESGMATNYHGFLNTPYFANEAGVETVFGKIVGPGVPDPGSKRHERTKDLLGRAFTWEYSPGLNSMHVYSTPVTTSWVIPTADGHMGLEWSGSGDFIKIRDQLYFARWQEEACNGTLGTILINMRTMHDCGIGYHCGKQGGLSMSNVGAWCRHAGKIDVAKFFGDKA